MKLGSQVLKMLNEIRVGRSQVVLDSGCYHGTYTTPAAKVVGEQGGEELSEVSINEDRNLEKGIILNFWKG